MAVTEPTTAASSRVEQMQAVVAAGLAVAHEAGDARAIARWNAFATSVIPLVARAEERGTSPAPRRQFRLGLDLDNCVFNETRAVIERIAEWRGIDPDTIPDPTSYDYEVSWPEHLGSRADFERIWDAAVAAGQLARMEPIPNAPEVIQRMARSGIKNCFVTARIGWPGRHAVTVASTAESLDAYDIPYDAIAFESDKTQVLTDMHVDDADHHVRSLVAEGRPVVLFHRPYNGPSASSETFELTGEPQPVTPTSLPRVAPPDGVPWVHPYEVGGANTGTPSAVVQVPVARSWLEVEPLIMERFFVAGHSLAPELKKNGIGFRERADERQARGEAVIARGAPTEAEAPLVPQRPGTGPRPEVAPIPGLRAVLTADDPSGLGL